MNLDALILACPSDRAAAVALTDALGAQGLKVQLALSPEDDLPNAACVVLTLTPGSACDDWLIAQCKKAVGAKCAIGVALRPGTHPPMPMPLYDYRTSGLLAKLTGEVLVSDIVAAVHAIGQNTFPPSPTARWRAFSKSFWIKLVAVAAVLGVVSNLAGIGDLPIWPRFYEEAAWRELQTGDPGCNDLRAFLNAYPNGRHATTVRDALANPVTENRSVSDFTPLRISGPLLTGSGYTTKVAAVEAAIEWAEGDAERQCSNISTKLAGERYEASSGPYQESCEEVGGRWLCAVEGNGTCEVLAPAPIEACRLPAHR